MSAVHLRNLGLQRNQPEDRKGLSRTRRPGRGHLGNSGGWQDTEGNHTHPSINLPIQQERQNKGLERHGSSSSAPPTPQRFILIEHGQKEEKTRIQAQKQDHLQPDEERVRPNDREAFGFGEKSAQEPEVAVNNFIISSPVNKNIAPTQIDHNVLTPESNRNSDALWLRMSQYAEETQKQFPELEASHERMKRLTTFMDKTVKNLQGHSKLSKASEETNKRLNLGFEQQHHSKRDRDCHGQQEVQPSIPLGRTWIKLPEDLSQIDRLQRPYGNHQRLESNKAVQTPVGEGKQDKG
ncbi:hypothetical protein O181_032810 [Austropuccinia psidii MF-1]|uniref:Uncharacterized protein n=1 Tax=Austropuccinia psidii MF-1 TaxID=1389203 RepID=A0A9Q3D097_9BASI|nr:hypothetical protein [Austropuccinia psidii MF-1]